jgi:hypothetical protein
MPEGTDPLFTAINLISWRGYSVQISHQQSLFLLLTDLKSWVRPSSLNSITAAVSMRGLFARAFGPRMLSPPPTLSPAGSFY